MNVWLLTIGDYSDYRVLGVFDDEHKQEAEKYAEMIGGEVEGTTRISNEPIELNHFQHDEVPDGLRFFVIEMRKNGNSTVNELPVLDEFGEKRKCQYKLYSPETDEFTAKFERKSYWRLRICFYTKSETHAVKIANDIRTQILAGNKPAKGDL